MRIETPVMHPTSLPIPVLSLPMRIEALEFDKPVYFGVAEFSAYL